MLQRILCFAIVTGLAGTLHADLDWGGGQTKFLDDAGTPLTATTGVGVLISSPNARPIDFETFKPTDPADLLRPGAILSDGTTANRVLASSRNFNSGYLLGTAIPDVSTELQKTFGAKAGEALFLMVWDARTFADGLPTDDSRFVLLPLFLEGDERTHASTFGDGSPLFAEICHPDNAVAVAAATNEARYCGFHRYADFSDWLREKHGFSDPAGAAELDPDRDGRGLYEEYVFEKRPGVETVGGTPVAVASLRAGDAELGYAVETSPDLSEWSRIELQFDGETWHSTDERIVIRQSEYAGNGVWTVSVAYGDTDGKGAGFFRFVVP